MIKKCLTDKVKEVSSLYGSIQSTTVFVNGILLLFPYSILPTVSPWCFRGQQLLLSTFSWIENLFPKSERFTIFLVAKLSRWCQWVKFIKCLRMVEGAWPDYWVETEKFISLILFVWTTFWYEDVWIRFIVIIVFERFQSYKKYNFSCLRECQDTLS